MKLPEWLPSISGRDEKHRSAQGLIPKLDGWYKCIDGKTRYVAKPMPVNEVLAILPARVAAIRAKAAGGGSAPVARVLIGSLSLDGLAEQYVAWLWQRLTTGVPKRLARRTYDNYVECINRFVEGAGPTRAADAIGPEDFSGHARTYFAGVSPNTVHREVTCIEAFANWAAPGPRKAGLLVKPWFFGPDFAKPTAAVIEANDASRDKAYGNAQLLAAFWDVRRSRTLTAAGYLGLTCAFGPSDVARLREDQIDWKGRAILFPLGRGKTGMKRMCPLLPQTVDALSDYLARRPAACDDDAKGLVFRTLNGRPYARLVRPDDAADGDPGRHYNTLAGRWHKLTGRGFSGLRSTFATLADDWPDQRAVDLVMGHRGKGATSSTTRSRKYAKRVDPERMRPLVEHVWKLVFGDGLLHENPLWPAADLGRHAGDDEI